MEQVILVDEHDNAVGAMEKIEAHKKGLLHRAFSLLIFNSKNEMLLQKRAKTKYHSAGLWTNACCSHPRPKETILDAANRRAKEEMGIDCSPIHNFSFVYKVALENDLVEHELDHVLTAKYDGVITINKDEVADWKYVPIDEIAAEVESNPDNYTFWFREIITNPSFKTLTKTI